MLLLSYINIVAAPAGDDINGDMTLDECAMIQTGWHIKPIHMKPNTTISREATRDDEGNTTQLISTRPHRRGLTYLLSLSYFCRPAGVSWR